MITTEGSDKPAWGFRYWYDAEAQRDMYEHGVGTIDEICAVSKVGPEGAPCGSLNDAAAGQVLVWGRDPGDMHVTACCEFIMGPSRSATYFIRSDWLRDSTYAGRQEVAGVPADVWTLQGNYDNHYAVHADDDGAAESEGGVPVSFWEHMGSRSSTPYKEWRFEAFAAQAQALEPPPECTRQPVKPCPGKP